jgi:hypothetical protein
MRRWVLALVAVSSLALGAALGFVIGWNRADFERVDHRRRL